MVQWEEGEAVDDVIYSQVGICIPQWNMGCRIMSLSKAIAGLFHSGIGMRNNVT